MTREKLEKDLRAMARRWKEQADRLETRAQDCSAYPTKQSSLRTGASKLLSCAIELLEHLNALPRPPTEGRDLGRETSMRCQHRLPARFGPSHERCPHGFTWGATCEECILSCPGCWDAYDSSPTFGPRPTGPKKASSRGGAKP